MTKAWSISCRFALSIVLVGVLVSTANAQTASPIQIYGVWHCGDDFCTWGSVRSIAESDEENHWVIDAHRSQLPFDPTGQNHTAQLTLDFAAGIAG